MTIKFIQRLALLILLGSSVACLKPKEKGVEYNSYTEKITENHRLIREEIQLFSDTISSLRDTASFLKRLGPVFKTMGEYQFSQPIPRIHTDSILFAASMRLNNRYHYILNEDFRGLFEIYIKPNPSEVDKQKSDSIYNAIIEEDSDAVRNFNLFAKDSIYKLIPFRKP